ncbi:phenylacetate--CoA ligase family protein [Methylobacterium nonmethylotrophicum]|uniref:Phenylacetate--CoA ligase family protein n=1 Tax=Methylobacterium nonmethylotrophicum TaxID=1141884 RepID=A0A4Z0NUN9_9HYPH|nr:AMP-binding protein [Methylobacterium nonmethylotrophicum]TGE01225.1 phenylacetate--CoA ligase family protein [Methylobacterium nonmethylotrophicum]
MPHDDAHASATPESALLARLPAALAAALRAPAYAAHLAGIDPAAVTDRAALARLPVLRKGEMPARQREALPFGGFVPGVAGGFPRLFTSPGPIFEPQRSGEDPWGGAPALAAAGFRPGEVVLNTFGYHLTPGGFIFDTAARALGCAVIPAGPGNTEQQLDLIEAYRPAGYVGTPDFLKVLLDSGQKAGRDVSSLVKALVSGAAFPPSLQAEFRERGIAAAQAYATADVGFIAYETPGEPGLRVGDGVILEIVRPGTGDPVPEGEVGEIVVTVLDLDRPLIRYALGDLTAALPGGRIRGWMGRADQAAKVKGMFVRPEQVAEIARRHPDLGRLRLVVTRADEADAMTLRAESASAEAALAEAVSETLRTVTKLRGTVELVAPGSLPNDGKVIADERPVG